MGWAWVIGIVAFLVTASKYPALWFLFFLIVAAGVVTLAYEIFSPGMKERAKKREEQEAKDRIEHEKQTELEEAQQRWLDANLPTSSQHRKAFEETYRDLLKEKGGIPLRDEVLNNFLDAIAARYGVEFPRVIESRIASLLLTAKAPLESLQHFTEVFLEALTVFTLKVPRPFLEPPNTASPFTQTIVLHSLISTKDNEWASEQTADAFLQFKPIFDKHWKQSHDFGLFHSGGYPDDLPHMEDWDTEAQRRAADRRHTKAITDYMDAMPRVPYAMLGTPFFKYADSLIPKKPVTQPLTVPPELWYSSTWVCAPQGRGKTNLLHNIIADRRKHGTVILMDASKTELIGPYMNEAFVIAPGQSPPPQFNPLDIGSSVHSVELLEYLFSTLLEAPMTPKQSLLFSGVLSLVVTIPNATIETFRQVILDGWQQFEPYVQKLHPRDRDFFLKGEYDQKGPEGYGNTKKELLWRLRLLMRNPYMAAMLEVPRTRINFSQLMDSRKLIVIDNDPHSLGDLGAEFFGRFIIALIWNAVRARSRNSGPKVPVFFIIDEAQAVIKRDDNIAKLIQQCRSQNVALIFAHQELQQMKSADVQGALSNCAIRLANPDGEKSVLASRLRTSVEFLDAMPKWHFAACIRDQPTVAVSVPLLDMKHYVRREAPPPPPDNGNYDYEWTITISPRTAENGGEVQVQDTLVRIPAGVTHAQRLRVRGRGAHKPDGTRGDLLLTLNVPRRQNPALEPPMRGREEIG